MFVLYSWSVLKYLVIDLLTCKSMTHNVMLIWLAVLFRAVVVETHGIETHSNACCSPSQVKEEELRFCEYHNCTMKKKLRTVSPDISSLCGCIVLASLFVVVDFFVVGTWAN